MIFGVLYAVILLVIDRLTKYLATVYLKPIGSVPLIKGVFDLSYVENTGAAFGMFQGARWFFVVLTVLILAALPYIYRRLPQTKYNRLMRFMMFQIAAGAVGNFIDRLIRGSVVDFFYFSLIDFPVFNMADIYLVTGSILFAIIMMLDTTPTKEEKSL